MLGWEEKKRERAKQIGLMLRCVSLGSLCTSLGVYWHLNHPELLAWTAATVAVIEVGRMIGAFMEATI